jgi:hypothetical protein
MMRKPLTALLIVVLAALLAAGCGKNAENLPDGIVGTDPRPNAEDIKNNESRETATDGDAAGNAAAGSGMLTSVEASLLAYGAAKDWRGDAVLWYLIPVAAQIDENWENSDRAYRWGALFVDSTDNKRYNVTIEGGAIKSAYEEEHTVREIDIPSGLPVDRPKVSMKDAAAAAIAADMPRHLENPLIYYTVENADKNARGYPVWEFAFGVNETICLYRVDGLTGQLLGIFGADGQPTSPPEKQAGPTASARETLGGFLDLLDAGKLAEVLALLDGDLISTADNKDMWEASLGGIASIKVVAVEDAFRDEWSEIREYYKCTLDVTLKPGSQPGLWEDGEITRWINLVLRDNTWVISEISMNP